jgi:hypothetical protein
MGAVSWLIEIKAQSVKDCGDEYIYPKIKKACIRQQLCRKDLTRCQRAAKPLDIT